MRRQHPVVISLRIFGQQVEGIGVHEERLLPAQSQHSVEDVGAFRLGPQAGAYAQGPGRFHRILESSGHRVLDDAARKAILRWTYEPARRGGRAVPHEMRQPVRFDLR